jgi:hypothetical protein
MTTPVLPAPQTPVIDPSTGGRLSKDWYRFFVAFGKQVTTILALATGALQKASNLADLGSAATARTNLGLGTAATHAAGDFATAAQGAKADTALQPSTDITVTHVKVGSSTVVGPRQTGWTAPTGTPARSSFDADWTQVVAGPTIAEVQAVTDKLTETRKALAALITDLETHGLVGP